MAEQTYRIGEETIVVADGMVVLRNGFETVRNDQLYDRESGFMVRYIPDDWTVTAEADTAGTEPWSTRTVYESENPFTKVVETRLITEVRHDGLAVESEYVRPSSIPMPRFAEEVREIDLADAFDWIDRTTEFSVYQGTVFAREVRTLSDDLVAETAQFFAGTEAIASRDWVDFGDVHRWETKSWQRVGGIDGARARILETWDDGTEFKRDDGPGGRTDTWRDALDTRDWSVRSKQYDAEGALVRSSVSYDDGPGIAWGFEAGLLVAKTVYDQSGTETWAKIEERFDETGALVQRSREDDDGMRTTTRYDDGAVLSTVKVDQGDLRTWSSSESRFDALGQDALRITTSDDGVLTFAMRSGGETVRRTAFDMKDSRGSAVEVTAFAGDTAARTVFRDDGTRLDGHGRTDGPAVVGTSRDAAGDVILRDAVRADGVAVTTIFAGGAPTYRVEIDLEDARSYSARLMQFEEDGGTVRTTFRDDGVRTDQSRSPEGSTWTRSQDRGDSFAWNEKVSFADPFGRVETTLERDDGLVEWRLVQDGVLRGRFVEDSPDLHSWASRQWTYDETGALIAFAETPDPPEMDGFLF